MKIVRYGIFLPSMLIGALTGLGAMIWPSVNTVQTGQTSEYQDLQPQYFEASVSNLADAIENTVAAHDRLRTSVDAPQHIADDNAQLNLIAKGPLLPTKTTIRITIHTSASGRRAVNMRADSASGTKTDFGQRARNIRFCKKKSTHAWRGKTGFLTTNRANSVRKNTMGDDTLFNTSSPSFITFFSWIR